MMQRIPVLRIFIRAIEDDSAAIIEIAAVIRAFSSQKKRNIAADGRKVNGYAAKVLCSRFFQTSIWISPSSPARMNDPIGA